MKDYYKTLGIEKDASEEDIKKSYRKLAMQWHPDKNPDKREEAEERFKEIAEAYAVLGDKTKRSQYDMGGTFSFEDLFRGKNPFGDFFRGDFSGNPFDVFGDVFGEIFGNIFSDFKSSKGPTVTVEMTLEEIVSGADKEIVYTQKEKCYDCYGRGIERTYQTCTDCNGTGHVDKKSFFSIKKEVCSHCYGSGEKPGQTCKKCKGLGDITKEMHKMFGIPAGVREDVVYPTTQGFNIKIKMTPHPKFQREGDDVYSTETLNYTDMLLNDQIEVETLYGKKSIKVPKGKKSAKWIKLTGEGVPHLMQKGKGNHYVSFKINIPEKITKEQKELLKELKEAGL